MQEIYIVYRNENIIMNSDIQKNGAGSGVEEQQRMGVGKILEANN